MTVLAETEGYFSLDGLELSADECFALDSLGFLIFVAAHRLGNAGEIPKTIQGVTPDQLEILRAEAVNLGAQVLVAAAQNKLPIEVSTADGSVFFTVRSHRRPTPPDDPA